MKDQTLTLNKCSAGRTGYDIRADVLSMAKDFLLKKYEYDHAKWNLDQRTVYPSYPSVEEILEVANKLNDFVGKK